MLENIIKYLEENKDKFSKESLADALRKAGYKEKNIQDGIKKVFEKSGASDFLNFKDKKIYYSGEEKMLDFFAGLFLPWLLFLPRYIYGYRFYFWRDILSVIIFILYVIGLIYFYRKRRYIFYGMILNILGSFIFPIFI